MSLLELMLAIAITGMLAVYGVQEVANKSDNVAAEGTAQHLTTVAAAAQQHTLLNYTALSDGTDVAATLVDLEPTVAELRAANRLPGAFPATAPGNQAVRVFIARSNCPGVNCLLTSSACTAQAFTVRGRVREELATTVVASMKGMGGRSFADAPATVRGASMNMANPLGAVTGIVCASTSVDTAIYQQFVRVRDTRDPDLRGGLTVQGVNATGEALRASGDLAVVNPGTGNVCVRLLRNGQVDINCDGVLNATTGTFTGPGGEVARVGMSGTGYLVYTNGRIRGEQGFWSALGSLYGDNTLGVRAQGTVFTIQTGAGVDALAVHDTGRMGSRASVATPMIGLTDPVAIGTPCTGNEVTATQVTTAATTVLRAAVGGGLAVCTGGQWSNVTPIGTVGGSCTINGSIASTSTGTALFCQNNTWVLLSDRMGYMIAAESWKVSDGQTVTKPLCAAGSTGARIYLQDENTLQRTQYVNREAIDGGTHWTVRMTDGARLSIPGTLVVTTYCMY